MGLRKARLLDYRYTEEYKGLSVKADTDPKIKQIMQEYASAYSLLFRATSKLREAYEETYPHKAGHATVPWD